MKQGKEHRSLQLSSRAPFMSGAVGKAVFSEVEREISDDSVDRLMTTCRAAIPGMAAAGSLGATVTAATVVTLGRGFASGVAAAAALGGIALGAYFMPLEEPPTPKEPAPIIEVTTPPDMRVTFTIIGEEGAATDPINPSLVTFSIFSSETLEHWVLTNSQGTSLYSGTNATINIEALGLADGDYSITWTVVNSKNVSSHAAWTFFIVS